VDNLRLLLRTIAGKIGFVPLSTTPPTQKKFGEHRLYQPFLALTPLLICYTDQGASVIDYSEVHLACTHVNFYANKRSNHYFLNKVHGLLLDRLTFINLTWVQEYKLNAPHCTV
jgi:hypothetical protein